MHKHDAIVIGTGQSGPALARRLVAAGQDVARMPKDGYYFDFVRPTMASTRIDPDAFQPSDTVTDEELDAFAEHGRFFYENTDKALLGWGASISMIGGSRSPHHAPFASATSRRHWGRVSSDCQYHARAMMAERYWCCARKSNIGSSMRDSYTQKATRTTDPPISPARTHGFVHPMLWPP